MSTLDKKRLAHLYRLLECQKDPDTAAAALRWAIFTLEVFLK